MALMTQVLENTPAPAFSLTTDGNGQASLSDFAGKAVVLYFYPKASTPGCTTEGLDFSALADQFAKANGVVIGVSRDEVKKLDRFKAKNEFNLILGSDEDGTVCEAYGTWVEKKLYGREYMGVERATFLIDGSGQVRKIWHNVKVKGHAQAVLDATRAL